MKAEKSVTVQEVSNVEEETDAGVCGSSVKLQVRKNIKKII